MATPERTCDKAEITGRLKELPGWAYDGKTITRTYATDGWKSTMMVVNAIAYVCETAGHHPDLEVSWPKVTVKLWTHSANGITDKDFATAKLIEQTVLWHPDKGSALRGSPKPTARGE
jgi:4a-hydroxytetrahydrobiopterin dehydratase